MYTRMLKSKKIKHYTTVYTVHSTQYGKCTNNHNLPPDPIITLFMASTADTNLFLITNTGCPKKSWETTVVILR